MINWKDNYNDNLQFESTWHIEKFQLALEIVYDLTAEVAWEGKKRENEIEGRRKKKNKGIINIKLK